MSCKEVCRGIRRVRTRWTPQRNNPGGDGSDMDNGAMNDVEPLFEFGVKAFLSFLSAGVALARWSNPRTLE